MSNVQTSKAMTTKLPLYLNYLGENLRNFDFASIRDSFNYIMFKKVPTMDRVIHSRMGTFLTRKKTTDFMYTNFAYEIQVKKFIQKHAIHYDVFVDIGSCIGDYSVWMASEGFKVFAVEPDPENFASLNENIRLNKFSSQITALNFGLAEKDGVLPFSNASSNKGASKIVQDENAEGNIKVPVHKWDNIVNTLHIAPNEKVLLKLDVEGMEEKVIRGMREFLKRQRNIILILEVKLGDEKNMRRLLQTTGNYSFERIDEHNIGAIKR